MTDKKRKQTAASRPTASSAARGTKAATFTAAERAAMRERARELKGGGSGDDEVRAKIAAMAPADRALAERVHALVQQVAPALTPRTWYGMPAYAREGQVVCFFQDAKKFKSRYATLGFSDKAALDEGVMWPTTFALTAWNATVESRIRDLLARAIH